MNDFSSPNSYYPWRRYGQWTASGFSYDDLSIYLAYVTAFKSSREPSPSLDKEHASAGYSCGYSRGLNGTIQGLIESVPYISQLNCNAIWHTPIFDSDMMSKDAAGSSDCKLDSTGYYVVDYFKVDPQFGTIHDYQGFTNKAHSKNLFVIMDIAVGHFKRPPPPAPDGTPLPVNADGKTTNFCDPNSVKYFAQVLRFWIETAHVDGFRFDQAYQAPPSFWTALLPMIDEVWANRRQRGELWGIAGFYVGEVWCGGKVSNASCLGSCVDNSDNTSVAQENMSRTIVESPFPCLFNFPLMIELQKTIAGTGSDFAPLSYSQTPSWSTLSTRNLAYWTLWSREKSLRSLVLMLDNHDTPRLVNLIMRGRGGADLFPLKVSLLMQLALGFLAHYPGPIQLMYNDEFATYVPGFTSAIPWPQCGEISLCDDHSGRTQAQRPTKASLPPWQQNVLDFWSKISQLRKTFRLGSPMTYQVVSQDELYVAVVQPWAWKQNRQFIVFVFNFSQMPQNRALYVKYPVDGLLSIKANALECHVGFGLGNSGSGYQIECSSVVIK